MSPVICQLYGRASLESSFFGDKAKERQLQLASKEMVNDESQDHCVVSLNAVTIRHISAKIMLLYVQSLWSYG